MFKDAEEVRPEARELKCMGWKPMTSKPIFSILHESDNNQSLLVTAAPLTSPECSNKKSAERKCRSADFLICFMYSIKELRQG